MADSLTLSLILILITISSILLFSVLTSKVCQNTIKYIPIVSNDNYLQKYKVSSIFNDMFTKDSIRV
jgi:hypothetical protein